MWACAAPSTALYIADDWRATQRLTLNLGLRYELDTPFTEVDDLWANFDPDTATVLVAGRNGVSRTAGVKTFKKAFAPRLGFAYQVAATHRGARRSGPLLEHAGQRRRRLAVAPARALRADLQLQPRHPVRHAACQRRFPHDSADGSDPCRQSQRQRDRRRSELSARLCRAVQPDGRTGVALRRCCSRCRTWATSASISTPRTTSIRRCRDRAPSTIAGRFSPCVPRWPT